MEKTISEKSFDMIEQKLTQYRSLTERREKLLEWLEKAEEHRSTVNDKIYQKVKTEYDQQLSEVVSDLSPIEREIGEGRESVQRRLADTEEELNSLQEQQEETVFRHRIGEYNQNKMTELETSLSPLIQEKTKQKETLATFLQRIDEALNESVPEDERRKTYADEMISGLADPVKDNFTSDEAIEEISKIDDDQMIPFPNLIVTTGNQSGKKIPLLPMTMTIGREHDNNIELKDEEVARYHARVVYEDNRFVLQDLNSSTGTWVNGEQITETALNNKDKIRFGKTEMVIDFS
jgi:hypothetical protein